MTASLPHRLRRLALLLPLLLLAPAPAAQRDSAFMGEFRKAMGANDVEAMARLIQENEASAIWAIIETCVAISNGPSDALEKEAGAFIKAWKKAYGTSFVQDQYEYFSLMDPRTKRSRKDMEAQYGLLFGEFERGREEKDAGVLAGVAAKFEALSAGYEGIGDLYMASVCSWHAAEALDSPLSGKNADLARACASYGRAWRLRTSIGVEDEIASQMKERFDQLEFEGHGDPSKGPAARAAAKAKENPEYAPHPLEASFEVAPPLEDLPRLLYHADEAYPTWLMMVLGEDGSTATIPGLQGSPTVHRESSAKVLLDADGDGTGEVEIPISGNPELVRFERPGRGPWAFVAQVGTEKDTYQGINPFYLAPSDYQIRLYLRPSSSVVATIGETPVRVLDDNMDGLHGSWPLAWAHLGVREGDFQWDCDGLLVGDAKRPVPFSRIVQVEGLWYELRPDEAGTGLLVNRIDVETGELELDLKGPDCDYLIVRGTGNNEDLYYDVSPRGGVEVPVGTYRVFTGCVREGSRSSMTKALVCAPPDGPKYEVTAGRTTKIELGAPFGFDFTFTEDAETVTVKGTSVIVTGRGGERYERLWNCVPLPEASMRAVGARRGGKGEEMERVMTQELVNEHGWDSAWFPQDLVLEKKDSGQDAEVQLVEKKNKLFGKIESEWRARE